MTRNKSVTSKPSRRRYEEKHPTVSFRLDREIYDRLREHLAGAGCSFADFIKDSLGREKSMIERRVEMLASRKADPSAEERLRFLESFMSLVMIRTYNHQIPWGCPRCGKDLADAMVAKKGSRDPDIFVYACPTCHYLVTPWLDAPQGIDLDTLRFLAKK